MDDTLEMVEKYKARLQPNNEFKKILRALQKLNEIRMTIELLQATGIGKVVNSLRKKDGLGDFAKEIVNKWKRLLAQGANTEKDISVSPMKKKHEIKLEPGEYDPTGNWKMNKSTKYTSSCVKEEPADCEYDPTQNWELKKNKKSAQNSSKAEKYTPAVSPVKKKREKNEKRRKKNENGKTSRESELKEMLEKAQAELKQIKKSKVEKVKVQMSPSPESSPPAPDSEPDEVEEYDPTENCKSTLNYDISPSNHDLRSPSSDYEPSGINRSIEYDPGPAKSSVHYKPSRTSYEPVSSRVTDDEEYLEEDEPGAFLLNRSRVNSESDRGRRLSSNCSDGMRSPDNPHDVPDSSLVLSTTLYSRNKSVDSEDGRWGSGVSNDESQVKSQPEVICDRKNKRKSENHEVRSSSSSANKKLKSERFLNGANDRRSKSKELISSDKKNKSSSEKRKSTSKEEVGPSTKKVKKSAIKKEPKDAGFLFEEIDHSKTKIKKKKKNKIKNGTNNKTSFTPSFPSKPTVSIKLDLHLPEIQTTYRPLPHANNASPEKLLSQLTDNEAAALHSKRNTKRMQVYAGQGGGTIPKMMSLFDQCMGVLLNNIDALDVIGGVPFEIIHPVLEKCTPEQLYRLEDSNPYLLEDTDTLWKKHAFNEFKHHKPEELELWREMYLRLHDEREAKLLSLTQIIQAKEAKKKPLEKKVQLAYVGMNAKAPRNMRKAQEKYGTAVRSSSHQSSSGSTIRQDLRDSRMKIKPSSVTAFTVDRMDKLRADKNKKQRNAPMMAKTLKSIGRFRFKR